ncbi:MAG: hypothetical protein JWR30_3329 [Conexibacter sp.]|nr:hypothetical protein [Conexibacter sp.]
MRRLLPYAIALILGAAAAVGVGCGDRSKLVPPSQASNLKAQLAQIKSDVDAGRCTGLTDKLRRLHSDAASLGPPVDHSLRSRINDGVRALEQTAPRDCASAAAATQTDTTPAQTVPTDTTPTETVPTDTTPTDTTPTDTTTVPPATTTEPTVPTDTTPAPSTTPDPNAPAAANGGTPGDGQVP